MSRAIHASEVLDESFGKGNGQRGGEMEVGIVIEDRGKKGKGLAKKERLRKLMTRVHNRQLGTAAK